MTRPTMTFVLAGVGWLTVALAIAWPVTALALSTMSQGVSPQDGFGFSSRQMLLLWRSVWMAGVATTLAIVISLPAAILIGRSGRLCHSAFVVAALAGVLFCPPMVYAFGWERALPLWFDPTIRCIAVWALWAWPISALIVGAGWARTGRRSFEAASLSAGNLRAFLGAAFPSLWRYVLLAGAVLFALLVGEYSVPHACGLIVYSTELLGWASNSANTIDSVWPALPVVALGVAGVTIAWRIGGGCIDEAAVDVPASSGPVGLTALAGVLFVVSWMIPLVGLAKRSGGGEAFSTALEVYGRDMGMSLGVATMAGTLVACVGVAVAMSGRIGGMIAMIALAWGVAPGALTGDAMVAAYNRASTGLIYDHWPIVAICLASRFAWVGAIFGLLPRMMTVPHLVSQARTDGASERAVASLVTIPMAAGLLVCAFAIAMALSVAELPATTMVRVPDYNPIALVIIEKFHRFEEQMLVALSFYLVVASVPAVLVSLWVLRRRE
jgi:ABC-type Fe3+ transport system permease subunit